MDEPTVEELWDAIARLWGWMPIAEVKEIQEEEPDLLALCYRAHERISHGSS